jgi:hypothetical protein
MGTSRVPAGYKTRPIATAALMKIRKSVYRANCDDDLPDRPTLSYYCVLTSVVVPEDDERPTADWLTRGGGRRCSFQSENLSVSAAICDR